MTVVSAFLVLIWAIVGFVQVGLGERKRLKFNIFSYTLIHVVCTILVYQRWVPECLDGRKDVFEYQILINYIVINLVSN